jgi:lysozyme
MANNIIDVSSHQGDIDWNQTKADGVEHSIIRLSIGDQNKDTKSAENANGASAAGIKVSYYHFAYPDTASGGNVSSDAKNEATYFANLFINGTLPNPEWLAVDLETWSPDTDSPLSPADYQLWLTVFLDTVKNLTFDPAKNTGLDCMIYGNKSYLDTHLPPGHPFGNRHLWIANYNDVPTPPLPVGWADYYMWQYSNQGFVGGINGFVDLSRLNNG